MNKQNGIPKKSKIDFESDFKISRMKPKIKATHPHKHDEYHEIIYLTEGAGFHTIDMNRTQVRPPQLFLVKAGQVHFWEFTEIPAGFVVIFRSDFLVHLVSSAIISGFEQLRRTHFNLNDTGTDAIAGLFEQMEDEYDHQEQYAHRITASFLEIVLARMIRLSQRDQQGTLTSGQKLVNNYHRLIHQHITSHHLVKEYAELLHVTPKHLNEACTSVNSKTASDILTEALVLEAKRRLLYTSGAIADIGYALGFNDASNFGTFFKRYAGITPGRFRKKML